MIRITRLWKKAFEPRACSAVVVCPSCVGAGGQGEGLARRPGGCVTAFSDQLSSLRGTGGLHSGCITVGCVCSLAPFFGKGGRQGHHNGRSSRYCGPTHREATARAPWLCPAV